MTQVEYRRFVSTKAVTSTDTDKEKIMTVIVDNFRVPKRIGRISSRWSHLTADTKDELHAFADRLGLKRSWFQDKGDGRWHYDVTDSKRDEAIRLGAKAVDIRDLGAFVTQRRLAESEGCAVTAGLGPTDGGSLTVDRNALVERWVETFGLDLASPIEGGLVVQEVAHVAGLVDAAVAAERQRIADELRALLLGRDAFHAWLAVHGLGDPGLGAALAVLMRDLRGTCGLCEGPAAFVGKGRSA